MSKAVPSLVEGHEMSKAKPDRQIAVDKGYTANDS